MTDVNVRRLPQEPYMQGNYSPLMTGIFLLGKQDLGGFDQLLWFYLCSIVPYYYNVVSVHVSNHPGVLSITRRSKLLRSYKKIIQR